MADNVTITPGSGATVATDDVGTVHYQRVKVDVGGDGVSVPAVGAIPTQQRIGATPVNTSYGATTSSTQMLAANSSRLYVVITNISDTNVTVAPHASVAVANTGIVLFPNGDRCFIDGWQGAIFVIHAGTGTKTLAITEISV